MDDAAFRQLVEEMYGPDGPVRDAAWGRFLNHFEAVITTAVRIGTRAPALRSQRDTADGVQSVLARLVEGREYWRPLLAGLSFDQARALICTTARNRLLQFLRAQHAQCRDAGRTTALDREFDLADATQADPAELAVNAEEQARLDQAIRRACRDEQQHAMVRDLLAGEGYLAVAARYNLSADAARMAFNRFKDRLQKELGIES